MSANFPLWKADAATGVRLGEGTQGGGRYNGLSPQLKREPKVICF